MQAATVAVVGNTASSAEHVAATVVAAAAALHGADVATIEGGVGVLSSGSGGGSPDGKLRS